MFAYSKYKLHYIDKLVTGEKSTVYRCGTLVDLCRGPHIQSTGKIKNFKIMQVNIVMVRKLLGGCAQLISGVRTLPRISSVIRPMTPCNVSVVLLSPTSSGSMNT